MEKSEPKKEKPLLVRQFSQDLQTRLRISHRRNKSDFEKQDFVNQTLVDLNKNPIEDAQQALLDGNEIKFKKALLALEQPEHFEEVAQLKARWIAMRRKRIQSDPFKTDDHSNGSKISYLTRRDYKIDTP